MNVQLPQVLANITGTTGLASIRAIVAGERDPVPSVWFRDLHCAHSRADIAKALTGHDRGEHVLALPQALTLYDVYTAQVRECDAQIARHCRAITPMWDDDLPSLNRQDKVLSRSQNAPAYDARSSLSQVTRGDLVAIPR
jgi:transposase